MLVELIVSALVVSFVAVVVLGHVALAAAIVQCVGGDAAGRPAAPRSDRHYRGIGGVTPSATSTQMSGAGHGAIAAQILRVV
jgi:hypothetical protein